MSTISIFADATTRQHLLSMVSSEVAEVESELRAQIRSDVRTVQAAAELTLGAGGKRLRPAFLMLAARAVDENVDDARIRKLGACMEIVHMATLVHDDVIDNASTRRGRPTAAAEFGNTAAILTGDVLLAKAMTLLAEDGDLQIIKSVSRAVREMAEGEVLEVENRGDFDLDESTYLRILDLKTAAFIRCCCEIGAIAAGATPAQMASLSSYGSKIGMAFQIADDMLDYRGDKAKTGKQIATDFREGQATLPLIALRGKLSDAEATIARRRFGGAANDDEVRMICDWMHTRGSFEICAFRAEELVDQAKRELDLLEDSLAKNLLLGLGDYVIERNA